MAAIDLHACGSSLLRRRRRLDRALRRVVEVDDLGWPRPIRPHVYHSSVPVGNNSRGGECAVVSTEQRQLEISDVLVDVADALAQGSLGFRFID